MNEELEALRDRVLQLEGALSIHRFLLEVVYANNFSGDLEHFDRFAAELMKLTQSNTVIPDGAELTDELIEQGVLGAVHLERFINSTRKRIISGRRV